MTLGSEADLRPYLECRPKCNVYPQESFDKMYVDMALMPVGV